MAAHGVALDYLTPLRKRTMDSQRSPLLPDFDDTHDHHSPNESRLHLSDNHEAQQTSSTFRERHNIRLLLYAGPALLLWYRKAFDTAEGLK